jgi:hypothetical protein
MTMWPVCAAIEHIRLVHTQKQLLGDLRFYARIERERAEKLQAKNLRRG